MPRFEVEGPDIIQANYMIVVLVGKQDSIQMLNFSTQHLLAQIRPGIDENIGAVVCEQGGGPQPIVPGIVGAANDTATPDNGYTL